AQLALYHAGLYERFLLSAEHDGNARERFHRDVLLRYELDIVSRLVNPNSNTSKALSLLTGLGPPKPVDMANDRAFRALPLMSVTGISNAATVALITGELAQGGGTLL